MMWGRNADAAYFNRRAVARRRLPRKCTHTLLVVAVVSAVFFAPRQNGVDAADASGSQGGGGVFNPRGSFGMTPAKAKQDMVSNRSRGDARKAEIAQLKGEAAAQWSSKQKVYKEDEFHPRRSYSQQLLSMMQNYSRSPLSDAAAEGVYTLANHSSVQELANTLLADPMSLFRRRR